MPATNYMNSQAGSPPRNSIRSDRWLSNSFLSIKANNKPQTIVEDGDGIGTGLRT